MTLCWLLTSTTYGTWLAGDARGFVSNLKDKTAETIPPQPVRPTL